MPNAAALRYLLIVGSPVGGVDDVTSLRGELLDDEVEAVLYPLGGFLSGVCIVSGRDSDLDVCPADVVDEAGGLMADV